MNRQNDENSQQSKSITIGQSMFSPQICQQIQSQTLQSLQFLNDQQWDVSTCFNMTAQGDYQRSKGPQIFKLMKQTHIQSLSLSDNCQSNIINQIEHIKFHKLKLLNLSQNQITSIQTLSTFYFPNLSTLNLLRNYIVSIKPFIKMHCPYLQILQIQDNLITDLTPVTKMSCISSLRQIAINFMIETICCDNISWVSKIDCPVFTQIWIAQYNRIRCQNILKTLNRKFMNAKIIIHTPLV